MHMWHPCWTAHASYIYFMSHAVAYCHCDSFSLIEVSYRPDLTGTSTVAADKDAVLHNSCRDILIPALSSVQFLVQLQ